MNLLMISGDRSLAAGKHGAFYNTLEELHRHFDRIDVICPKISVQHYDMQVFGNVFVHPSPWPLIFQPLWIRNIGRRLVRQHRHQVATCHDYPPFYNGLGAWSLNRATDIPYLSEIFHIEGYPRASSLRERLWRWWTARFVRFAVRYASAVRIMNNRVGDFLERHGVRRSKFRLVPAIYLDIDTFQPMDLEKKYDIAFVGRMARNKGLDLFLDVLERTGRVGVAVGDGPLLSWVRQQAKHRSLKLHTPGFAKDSNEVARYLNESRLLLMTSLNEGGPRVVPEAMACGVPVVATPVGIVPDILPPECIEEWDAEALVDRVQNILNDKSLYVRLREDGIAAVQGMDRKTAVAAYADAIKSIAL